MPAISSGILLYRRAPAAGDEPAAGALAASAVEVLLAHQGGPYWRRKDDGAWGIPKGQAEDGELLNPPPPAESWQRPARLKPRLAAAGADLLAVAKREFREETGFASDEVAASGARYLPLGGIKQRGHKIVYAWALEGDLDPAAIDSLQFEMEWPPRSGKTAAFPEIDRVAWFSLAAASVKILAGQRRFLDDLTALLAARPVD